MFDNRNGEGGEIPFRSGRFYTYGGGWYFKTRENPMNGPYYYRDQAEAALAVFLQRMAIARRHQHH